MKLIKKVLSIIIAVVLSLNLLMVSAASTVEVGMDYMNLMSVSGIIDEDNMMPANIIVRLTDSSDKLVYADVSKTVSEDDGVLSYSFDNALLSLSLPSDTYTVTISGRNLKTPLTDSIDIHGADRKFKVLKAISDATTASAVKTVITGTTDGKDNYDVLKFDIELYNDLETDDGNFVDEYLKGKTYDLSINTEDGLSDEEIAKIHSAIEVFHKDYTDAVAAAKFAMIDSKDKLESWYDTYYEGYEFDKDTEITAIVKEVMAEEDFVRRMTEQSEVLPIEDIKTFIYESALCTYVYVKTDSEVEELVDNFSEYFASGESYGKLKSYEIPVVIGKITGNIYDNCADVADALDDEAKAVIEARKKDDKDNGRGGGGRGVAVSSSGGSVGGSDPSKEEESEQEPNPVTPVIFSDLDSVPWADDAILYLYDKGIVSGNPDGSFMPNTNITRAEFIKIVVKAFDIAESAENVFADVAETSWYAPYVFKAYAKGLVKGDDNNNFCPDAYITRQDMVTILYRALGPVSEDVPQVTFTDKDTIANYAYPAVEYFAGNGIVNGFEDGSFAPVGNTTRAQAAVVIYRLIVNLL